MSCQFPLDIFCIEFLLLHQHLRTLLVVLLSLTFLLQRLLLNSLLLDSLLILTLIVDMCSLNALHATGQTEITDFDCAVLVEKDVCFD
jgi:hypothetical protein